MPTQLTPRAKSIVAAAAAVVLAGITAWQTVTRDGFSWADIAPVAVAVLAVIGTDLIPNTGNQPVAKAIVHGALAVASAVATVVAADPHGYTAAKLLTVAVGAALVWFVPEAAPAVKVIEGELATGTPAAQVLATVAADVSASMGPDLPANAPTVATTALAAPPSEPTPIADATASALTDTAPLPAVTA